MIDPAVIDRVVERFAESNADCATPVVKITSMNYLFDPDTPKVVMRADGFALYFSRTPIPYFRDRSPEEWLDLHTFHRHVGLYLYGESTLKRFVAASPCTIEVAEQLEQLRMLELGMSILCVDVEYDGQAVDSPEDVMRVETRLRG